MSEYTVYKIVAGNAEISRVGRHVVFLLSRLLAGPAAQLDFDTQ